MVRTSDRSEGGPELAEKYPGDVVVQTDFQKWRIYIGSLSDYTMSGAIVAYGARCSGHQVTVSLAVCISTA